MSSHDGSVIPRCRLTLRRTPEEGRRSGPDGASDDASTVAESDERGHFQIQVASLGSWQLSATAKGFRSQAYAHHEEFSSAIVLTQAEPKLNIVFKLDPDPILVGTILDEAGEPVRGAVVEALRTEARTMDAGARPGVRGRISGVSNDLGRYEITGLAPGDYRVSVQAKPWYASAPQNRPAAINAASGGEPSLDLIYPLTWFPGVEDSKAADILSMRPGEVREADFNLNPAPGTHLRLNSSLLASPVTSDERAAPVVQMDRLGPNGFNFENVQTSIGPDRQVEVSGLAPGLYRIHSRTGPGQTDQVSFLQVSGGAGRLLDAGAAVEAARLSVQFQGLADGSRIDLSLTEAESGIIFRADSEQRGFRRRQPGGDAAAETPMLQVPEGRYLVTLSGGGQDVFLRSMKLNGAPVSGRLISLHRGDNQLAVTVSSGRAAVRGIASFEGKPVAGAMVLLVPTTFGDPASIASIRRDQTNTDGSFAIDRIVPGQYILSVVNGGWASNWRSSKNLERYLMHGVPLSLGSGAESKQDVAAQAP